MSKLSAVLSAALLILPACAHNQAATKTSTGSENAPATGAAPAAPASTSTLGKACSLDSDCSSGESCQAGHCALASAKADCQLPRIHFGFDDTTIQTQDRDALAAIAECIRSQGPVHIKIAGNADERGTEEYNLHLGERRAAAVRKYLAALGVSPEQLELTSFGKDNPLCAEHDESCWAQNRRADLTRSGTANN